MVAVEAVIWYLLLFDSIGAVVTSFYCAKWVKKTFPKISKHFPITKGWAIAYFVLVLWVGYGLSRLNII